MNKQPQNTFSSQLKGILFQALGAVVFLIGAVLLMLINPGSSSKSIVELISPHAYINIPLAIIFGLITASSFVIGIKIFNYGRRLRMPLASDAVPRGKPYVLYLRSFKSDPITADVPIEGVGQYKVPMSFTTEEEKLFKALKVVGVGLAIGEPGDMLPPLGFYRIYVTNDIWMTKVRELMLEAQMVVLRIGESDGLLWELQEAKKLLKPERLVILVPNNSKLVLDPDETSDFDKGFRLFPKEPKTPKQVELCPGLELPAFGGKAVHKTSLAGIIYFKPDWSAQAMALNEDNFSLKQALETALEPVFKQLNIKLRFSLYRILYRPISPSYLYITLCVSIIALIIYILMR